MAQLAAHSMPFFMTSRIRKFSRLSHDRKLLLCKAMIWLPLIAVMLRIRGFRRTLMKVQSRQVDLQEKFITDDGLNQARMFAQLIEIADRNSVFNARCLTKSIVLIKFLHDQSIGGQLVLGARKTGEQFGAHAWVEVQGTKINDQDYRAPDYSAFQKLNNLIK
jgi:hypothetical protein